MTISELFLGEHLASTDAHRQRRQAVIDALIQGSRILDFTRAAAMVHARISASLRRGGNMIGARDLIIAATALRHGPGILAANFGESERMPGLQVVRWTTL
jgi:predicted nucleic acid-binding protein